MQKPDNKHTNHFLRFFLKWIPTGSIFPYLLVFAFQTIAYFVTELFAKSITRHNITTSIDQKVPVIPVFIYIYFGCYLFWLINMMLGGRVSKEHFYKLCTTSVICTILCACIYLVYPCTLTRPEIKVTDVNTFFLDVLYKIDQPVNLCPSLHCLTSWLCVISVRKQKSIPTGYRIFSYIYALLILISTQVLKQHVLIDLITGVLVAEIIWQIVNHNNFYRKVQNLLERVNERFSIPWNTYYS